ncbi:hypothetical protein Q3G72_018682 [Acer saccharum]|nr:hypothetical protein Q3G72_018682 [Acer saccharum]
MTDPEAQTCALGWPFAYYRMLRNRVWVQWCGGTAAGSRLKDGEDGAVTMLAARLGNGSNAAARRPQIGPTVTALRRLPEGLKATRKLRVGWYRPYRDG